MNNLNLLGQLTAPTTVGSGVLLGVTVESLMSSHCILKHIVEVIIYPLPLLLVNVVAKRQTSLNNAPLQLIKLSNHFQI